MKKLLVVMVFVLGALVANAQRTPVKISDLPKGVADSIQKEYSGYTIKESAKNVENNVTTYEVVVSKGTDQKTLTYDNQGKSLKAKGDMDKWDMDKDKSKTPNTDMDKSKTTPSSTSPNYPSSSPSSTPSSTTPSSTTPSSTTPSSSPSSTSPSSTPSTEPK